MNGTTVIDEALVRSLRAAVATDLTSRAEAAQFSGRRYDRDDEAMLARRLINEQLERHAASCLAHNEPVLSEAQESAVARSVFDRIFQLGRLQPLIDDEQILNIVANGHDQVFVEYADGSKVACSPIASSDAELIEMLREIGRRYGLSEVVVDQDGERAALPGVSPQRAAPPDPPREA